MWELHRGLSAALLPDIMGMSVQRFAAALEHEAWLVQGMEWRSSTAEPPLLPSWTLHAALLPVTSQSSRSSSRGMQQAVMRSGAVPVHGAVGKHSQESARTLHTAEATIGSSSGPKVLLWLLLLLHLLLLPSPSTWSEH
jgi:hypothetical protein